MQRFRNFDAPSRPQVVTISWRKVLVNDGDHGRPDEDNEGFWPSQDETSPGYVKPELYKSEMEKAKQRMSDWKNGYWYFCGVCAVADISIPIGNGAFTMHSIYSPGLWGIKSDQDTYIEEVFEEEKAELIAQLKTLGAYVATLD